jgi:hypothetical protein
VPDPQWQGLRPTRLRCQWTEPGGYPQCYLRHGHTGDHQFFRSDQPFTCGETWHRPDGVRLVCCRTERHEGDHWWAYPPNRERK